MGDGWISTEAKFGPLCLPDRIALDSPSLSQVEAMTKIVTCRAKAVPSQLAVCRIFRAL
jgi:hypothetical protein